MSEPMGTRRFENLFESSHPGLCGWCIAGASALLVWFVLMMLMILL